MDNLAAYYKNIGERFTDLPAFDSKKPKLHPRFFPSATHYCHLTKGHINFQYVGRLEANDPACVTFLAKTEAAFKPDIVVKFVATYGKDVHELLAREGYAPSLHYYGAIPGLEDVPFDREFEQRRLLPLMQMVVMDYVESSDDLPDRDSTRRQLEQVLSIMHTEGYVCGDLRRPNVLFDTSGKLKVIDFDWAGRSDADPSSHLECAHYPLNLSSDIKWARGIGDRGLILSAHDKEMMEILLQEMYPPQHL
ncbi:hypothetical protein APHAL10511_003459 [Amanita phalloides]|nr:hypothetical protein APHAL10511_003459 [Amanita phalloides]